MSRGEKCEGRKDKFVDDVTSKSAKSIDISGFYHPPQCCESSATDDLISSLLSTTLQRDNSVPTSLLNLLSPFGQLALLFHWFRNNKTLMCYEPIEVLGKLFMKSG